MIVSVFYSIQTKHVLEQSKTLIHNYCNNSLDEIQKYVEKATEGISVHDQGSGFAKYNMEFIQKDEDGSPIREDNGDYAITKILITCDEDDGISIDGDADNLPVFFAEDPMFRNSFTIKNFRIEQALENIEEGEESPLSLSPTNIDDYNQSAYDIIIDVDIIYEYYGTVTESLIYTRRAFSPNSFIESSQS